MKITIYFFNEMIKVNSIVLIKKDNDSLLNYVSVISVSKTILVSCDLECLLQLLEKRISLDIDVIGVCSVKLIQDNLKTIPNC